MNRRNFITASAAFVAGLLARINPLGATTNAPAAPASVEYGDLLWGTYGKDAQGPLRMKKLRDCDTDHLQNILRTESWHINVTYRRAIEQLLKDRGVTPLPTSLRATTYEQRLAMQRER